MFRGQCPGMVEYLKAMHGYLKAMHGHQPAWGTTT